MLSRKFWCHQLISFVFLILSYGNMVCYAEAFCRFLLFSLVYVDFQTGNIVATFLVNVDIKQSNMLYNT